MIAVTSQEDLKQIFDMVLLLEKEVSFVKPNMDLFIHNWSTLIGNGSGVILHDDHGFIAGFITPEINSGTLIAVECLWWVAPNERKKGLGKKLLSQFEFWAKIKGAKYISTAKPFKRLKINNYKSVETLLIKEI